VVDATVNGEVPVTIVDISLVPCTVLEPVIAPVTPSVPPIVVFPDMFAVPDTFNAYVPGATFTPNLLFVLSQ
jgi:hypothetical protein